MTFTLRPHQVECLRYSKEKNTIACLPTGYGKTLIAAKLIEHHLTIFPDKKVAFLVPTRPLVEQQANYCETHCDVPLVVERVFGEEQSKWTRRDWDDCCVRSHVFLGTAALFQQAFVTDRFLSLDDFSLLVFDECHNCVGNSPMAAVMRDAVAPYYDQLQNTSRKGGSIPPRILGLTASFVNGSLKNIAKKRQTLEALMLSTIVCPNVTSRLEAENYTHISWTGKKAVDGETTRRQEEAIECRVREAVSTVAHVKEITKVISRCSHVFK
jgi:ERCC4-related helicase